MEEVVRFWSVFYNVFKVETSNQKCGSHVHVAPLNSGFDIGSLRQIAYAVIVYEKHVLEILPPQRRNQFFCKPNTTISPALKRLF